MWVGPYQIQEILSPNVYVVQSLTNKRQTVHSSRLILYSGSSFIPPPKWKNIYVQNFEALEVDEIVNITLNTKVKTPYYQVEIKWLGFEEVDNTFQRLEPVYEDLPLLVRKFLKNTDRLTITQKTEIERYLLRLDRKELAKYKKRQPRKRKIKARAVIPPKLPTGYQRVLINRQSQPRSLGWHNIEKKILCLAIAKYGSGNYKEIERRGLLPFKTTQQMYTQAQRQMNIQSIGLLRGINLHVDVVRQYFDNYFRSRKFHKKDLGEHLTENEKTALRSFYQAKFQLTRTEIEEVRIPYYRRVEETAHLSRFLEELRAESPGAQEFLRQLPYTYEDLLEELKRRNVMKETHITTHLPSLDEFAKLLLNKPQIFHSATHLYLQLHSRRYEDMNRDKGLQTQFQIGVEVIKVILEENRVRIGVTMAGSDRRRHFEYLGGNEFAFEQIRFFVEPEGAIPYLGNVLDYNYRHLIRNQKTYRVILMDPPWQRDGEVSKQGPSFRDTLKVSELERLPLNLLQSDGDYLFAWITNNTFLPFSHWMESQHYYLVDTITWLKTTRNGKLRNSLGYYLQHCKSSCLVFQKKLHPTTEYQNILLELEPHSADDLICTLTQRQLEKPTELYEKIERTFIEGDFLELFGRSTTLRKRWTTIGLQLEPAADVCYVKKLYRECFFFEEAMSGA